MLVLTAVSHCRLAPRCRAWELQQQQRHQHHPWHLLHHYSQLLHQPHPFSLLLHQPSRCFLVLYQNRFSRLLPVQLRLGLCLPRLQRPFLGRALMFLGRALMHVVRHNARQCLPA